jgi:hypothetical protein
MTQRRAALPPQHIHKAWHNRMEPKRRQFQSQGNQQPAPTVLTHVSMTLTRAVAALPSTMTAIRRPDNGGGARRAAERGAHGPGIHDALGVAAAAGQGRVVLRGEQGGLVSQHGCACEGKCACAHARARSVGARTAPASRGLTGRRTCRFRRRATWRARCRGRWSRRLSTRTGPPTRSRCSRPGRGCTQLSRAWASCCIWCPRPGTSQRGTLPRGLRGWRGRGGREGRAADGAARALGARGRWAAATPPGAAWPQALPPRSRARAPPLPLSARLLRRRSPAKAGVAASSSAAQKRWRTATIADRCPGQVGGPEYGGGGWGASLGARAALRVCPAGSRPRSWRHNTRSARGAANTLRSPGFGEGPGWRCPPHLEGCTDAVQPGRYRADLCQTNLWLCSRHS